MQKTLKSKRLVLRPVAPVDADWLVDLWSLPEVHRNVASIPASPDKDFVLRRIHSGNEGEEAFTDICRMIELDEKRAGMISLNRTSIVDAFGLGYSLHPEFSGQGIMTEAAQTLLNWSDGFVAPKYYISGHFTDNPASGSVLRKLGFLPCWRAPVYSIGRDERVDHLYMSRLIG
ncbi:GNAT family N-acetyltransferase [Ponticaulis sp.]|uniref:GNAT family N-acetyltransferase n=1 Tax=Ponticaulis sp. TaxID=2020902 RepID=UPI0025DF7FB1|nr:GNAT family N-acetyltransferase [Ponticaulis sp.]|tara:strand:- start:18043 stop:18564 length:522 start_codon:yes stop_codon:yes gene_type:complete